MSFVLKEKLSLLSKHLSYIKKEYNVERIGFFGSVVRDDFTPESDIDVLVEFADPIGYFKFMQLERYLSDLLGFKVDLTTRAAIKKSIKESILKDTVYV